MKRWLVYVIISVILFISHKAKGQTYTQTFVDRCTGETKLAVTTYINGNAVVSFYNQIRTFTPIEVQSGALQAWLITTKVTYEAMTCPTATVITNVISTTISQTVANTATAAAASAAAAAASAAASAASSAASSSASSAASSSASAAASAAVSVPTPTMAPPPPTPTATPPPAPAAAPAPAPTESKPASAAPAPAESKSEPKPAESKTEAKTESKEEAKTESKTESKEEAKSESKSESKEEAKSEEKKSESKSEEKKSESKSEQKKEQKKEEAKKKEEEKKKKEEERKKKEQQRALNPMLLASDLTASQGADGKYTESITIGVSKSSMMGDKSWSGTSMIYSNLTQFVLAGGYTKMMFKDGGLNAIHSYSTAEAYLQGNYMNLVGYTYIKPNPKYGTYGYNVGVINLFLKDGTKFNYNMSSSIVAFWTKPYPYSRKLVISPQVFTMFSPVAWNTVSGVTTINTNMGYMLGASFDYKISKRFGFSFNYKFSGSTQKGIPILNNFLIGSRVIL